MGGKAAHSIPPAALIIVIPTRNEEESICILLSFFKDLGHGTYPHIADFVCVVRIAYLM